ncbi:uncharacterized protein BJ212DRAFT_1484306 [Suillus subaureus]|uniref:Uncharacterized protein n=1 Tax=Suillus subaureus TaxID=48587 RepID=A0A9P7J9C4_9AGAM|nr:uncharacterized protein BJ212DRAFT_1484306 [Suillus subaureus]KAG1809600.1 hypothetical protein BJ212DRAFT_1484306 [Suillus subaureus]
MADILMFTKDKFRNYKCKYDERTHVEKGKKHQELSQLDMDNDVTKSMHCTELKKVAQLNTADVKDGVAIWEFNSVMDKLDQIQAKQWKKAGNKVTCTRCINLNNKNTAPPQQPIFPFMLNTNWYKAYVNDNPGMKVVVLKKDPIGFGLVDEPNEMADDQGAKTTDMMDVNGDGTDGEDETAEDAWL